MIKTPDGMEIELLQFKRTPGAVNITMHDGAGHMAQGLANLRKQALIWYDTREHSDASGRPVAANVTVKDAQRAWKTLRGQQLAQLARKAVASCDSTVQLRTERP